MALRLLPGASLFPRRGPSLITRPWNLARQYSLASLLVLLLSLLLIGWWVGRQIEVGVTHRAAAAAALYVENFIVTHLQGLKRQRWLSAREKAELERLFTTTPLGHEIVSIKVWGPGGRVVYGDEAGRTFSVGEDQARAWKGEVSSDISDLTDAENVNLKAKHHRLLEIYAPMRLEGSDRVIAVAEFYQSVVPLERAIRQAQIESWLLVGAVLLLAYLLLLGLVRRGSDTIAHQQAALGAQLAEQRALMIQNAELHDRVQRAATRIAELHERVMERVSSGLHDGPAQDVSYALLRLDSLSARTERLESPYREQAEQDLAALERSLTGAMRAMRDLATEVRLPALHALTLEETLERAVRDHHNRTGSEVGTHWAGLPQQAPLPVKITAFRVVREALSNAYKHAGGQAQWVRARALENALLLEVSDGGAGFDPSVIDLEGSRLGFMGMRERVESLGGAFAVYSASSGTRVQVHLPLTVRSTLEETP
ncbi:sensor histidine kinase [Deinococcus hopiensis]|uniref:histidine kinase n=1 Tax=Deinococcus hopiensis KR-140 TaxID=695939 RepID=A0A1W1UTA6_9DEIO|nr:ATP-binding protein [Deinococcus hopiensis]SMB84365.1 Signal transduction histidine kinase [Deinococcus hopiensis KR-140]